MNRLLSEMQNHASSWPFREPVKLSDAADYYEVIEQPMGSSFFLFWLENFRSKAKRTILFLRCDRFENYGRETGEWQVPKLGRIRRRRTVDFRQLSVLQRRGIDVVQACEPTRKGVQGQLGPFA
jgi:hypothetical protein